MSGHTDACSDRLWRFEGGAECPFFLFKLSDLARDLAPSAFDVENKKNKNDVDISAISYSVYFWMPD